ncbi:MAG TPA: hypothetical protein ENH05_04910 [Rhizobiales bacterium]|nr:hypothetical protein [Hyphomicrobiales bacterium]
MGRSEIVPEAGADDMAAFQRGPVQVPHERQLHARLGDPAGRGGAANARPGRHFPTPGLYDPGFNEPAHGDGRS